MTTSERITKEIFLDALEESGDARAQLVRRRCGADSGLVARVEELLQAHTKSDTLFRPLAVPALGSNVLRPGLRVGSCDLVEEIGEGGFAVVWRAQQTSPVNRAVAIKLLKPGMDTREIITRFEAERQALALMSHPSIARVFDGGATEWGRPWFAMELVDGVPITNFCAAQGLGKRERLELFLEVCRAVRHAHQKGVIHRDLKPTNVLVEMVDGRPAPKVIDFGIAKAMQHKLVDDSILTRQGQLLGTPAYMSPEQVDEAEDIDTRSDVYSLGVLLYEVMSGAQPIGLETLRDAGLSELLRVIREVDPPRPSSRLIDRPDQSSAGPVAAKDLQGDLDWIIMRCLEKDRERRYDSVSALAADVERHLDGDVVVAGPPDWSYRARKFVARHKASLSFTALIAGLLIVGTMVSVLFMLRAQKAEDDLSAEVMRTETELAKYQSISSFFEGLFMGVDPAFAQGKDTELLQQVLDRAAADIDQNGGAVPEVEATLRRVIGSAYLSLAMDEPARRHLEHAHAIRQRILHRDHPDLLQSQSDLGGYFLATGQIGKAEHLLRVALEGRRRILTPHHADLLESMGNMGVLLKEKGQFERAYMLLAEVEAARLAIHGKAHPATIRVLNNVANALENLGRIDEAAERYERAALLQLEVQGRRHPETLKAFNNLGAILVRQGRTEEGAAYFQTALALKREVLPDGDRSLLVSINSLARLHQKNGHIEEAEELFLEACAMVERTGAGQSGHGIILRFNYALLLAATERDEAAEEEYRRATQAAHGTLGARSRLGITMEGALAWQMHRNGKSREAEPMARTVVEHAHAVLSPEEAELGMHLVRHGIILLALGDEDEGKGTLEAGLAIVRAKNVVTWIERGEAALRAANL